MPEGKSEERTMLPPQAEAPVEGSPPWEMIENGRYMPRRIRGSFHGRELG